MKRGRGQYKVENMHCLLYNEVICLEGKTIGLRNSELLIIIPAYNESGNIEKTIKMIEEHTPEFDYVIYQ